MLQKTLEKTKIINQELESVTMNEMNDMWKKGTWFWATKKKVS